MQLEHKTTYDTGLYAFGYTRFCVMESTGYIIFVGKEEEDNPVAFHINKYKDGWQKIGTKPGPCSQSILSILPLMIENNERLLVSCYTCNTIWFCDLYTGNFNVPLKEELLGLGLMCKAEEDYIYIVNDVAGLSTPILKAKCTATELSLDKSKTIYSRTKTITSICYLAFVKCIAISNWTDNVVKAIHCETHAEVWEVKGKVAGVTWMPHSLLYSPEHQSLLVCDINDDGRLVVLEPSDGSVLQVIPLSILGVPWFFYIHKGNVIMLNSGKTFKKIDIFDID